MPFSGTSRFRPIRLLGTGGMGSVYLVHDQQLGRKVALKTLNLATGGDLYQLKREFRSMADLKHENLVTLHELISEGTLWFYTMEYVLGVPFDRYLLASRHETSEEAVAPPADPAAPWPEDRRDRLLPTMRQLCAGVHAIHEAGLIHRDLKPSNVLVTDAGRVVILDFGLTKQAGSNSMSGEGMSGTPAYMAPEQALERPCLPATDWYAVGAMIYEVLTGRCPFEGSMLDILLRKQSEDPLPPSQLTSPVDNDLSDLCMRLLQREPAQRPTGGEVLARLGAVPGKSGLPQAGRSTTPIGLPAMNMLGREAELQALCAAYARVRKGLFAGVIVQGTSGIGKTSLVETFLRGLIETGATATHPLVLRGRCHERETLPFKAFDGVVDSLSHRLANLAGDEQSYVLPDGILYLSEIFPVLRRLKLTEQARYFLPPLPDAKELRNQAFLAFCDLLVHLARIQPVVIFVDDMQWADRDSCALLRALLQGPRVPALLLIANTRPISDCAPGTVGALLREFAGEPSVASVALGPLSAEATCALADALIDRSHIGPVDRQRIAATVASEAGGNPFFAVELVQHFVGLLTPAGGPATPTDESEFRLDGMILKRVGGLPSESQRMLEVIAVASDPLPQRALAGAIGVAFGSPEWERGITALLEERLITRRGRQATDVVEIYHDRIGEAVTGHLDPTAVKRVHYQLAQAVEQWDGARTDRLARYWLSAEDNERAKRYTCEAAGEALTKLAFDRAAELYEAAIALESDRTQRTVLLRALGDCRASNGHTSLAAEAYERAAALSDTMQSVQLRHLAAEQLLRGGQIAQGLAVLKDVLKQTGLHLAVNPGRALLSVLWRLVWLRLRGVKFVERPAIGISPEDQRLLDVCWSVNIGLGVVDILRADDFLLRFLILALKVGDMQRVAQGLAMLASQLTALGTSHRSWAMRLVSEAEVLARRSANPATIALAAISKGVIRYFLGEWDLAANLLIAAEQYLLSHCHGVNWELATTRSFACFSLRLAGRLRELCERFDRYTADADRTGDHYLAANLRTYQSIAWMIRDDCARAAKDIEGILDGWPSDSYQVQHFFHLYARCEHALYEGRPTVAFRAIAEDSPRIRRSALLRIRCIRVEHAWICGRVAVAMAESVSERERPAILRHASASLRFLRNGEHQTGVAMGATIEAGVRWLAPGADRRAALATLERAVATAEAAGSPLLAEAARRWLGEITGGHRGEELIARANAWMAEQGVRNPTRLAAMIVPGFQSRST
jgi:tetratricopeptide (TPR) repeat protein